MAGARQANGFYDQKAGEPPTANSESGSRGGRLMPLTEECISGLQDTASAELDQHPESQVRLIRAMKNALDPQE